MKKSNILLALMITLMLSSNLFAQETKQKRTSYINNTSSIGIGFGLPYGGIGGNIEFLANKTIGVFAGAGYAGVDKGYNIGIKSRFKPLKNPKVRIYIEAMYGVNAFAQSHVDGYTSKNFNGTSIGFGLEYKGKEKSKGYLVFGFNIPFRSSKYYDYVDTLNKELEKELNAKLIKIDIPLNFTLAYRFKL